MERHARYLIYRPMVALRPSLVPCKILSRKDLSAGGHVANAGFEQEYVEVMGPHLGRFYSLLVNECNQLHLEWNEFKEFFGTSPERIALLNQAAPAFFSRLHSTLWDVVLLRIARLMDPPNSGVGKENVTLLGLPELVDPTIRYKIDILLKVAQEECAFSLDWRKRRIAHRDLNLALKENSKPLASASRLSVGAAVEAIAEVLNAVESHYCTGTKWAYDWNESSRGAKALLYLLREGLEARAGRRLRLASGQPLPEDTAPKRPI